MTEVEEKTARLVRLAEARGLCGIIIASQPGFSWLTGGPSNRIDGSRENGSGALFVRAGADAGAAVGAVARTLQPGLAETEIASSWP